MAGSYEHLTNGWALIENMGDAYESTEELLWLIERCIGEDKAKKLLEEEFYPMQRGEIQKDKALIKTEKLMTS